MCAHAIFNRKDRRFPELYRNTTHAEPQRCILCMQTCCSHSTITIRYTNENLSNQERRIHLTNQEELHRRQTNTNQDVILHDTMIGCTVLSLIPSEASE